MNYKVFTDGGSRGNPGPAALGFVIYDSSNKLIFEYSKYVGETTNNSAEYLALLFACYKLKSIKAKEVEFYLDSELVVKQIKGEYKIKDEQLKNLYDKIQNELKNFKFTINHVPREKNKEADKLVNQALDMEQRKNGYRKN